MNSKRQDKIHSVKYNFFMNFILTASSFLFPLITFPYISRVLGAAGNGKVAFAASVANYFMMTASLGIPTYGVRACAQVRDDRRLLSKTVVEIFLINFVATITVIITYIICVFSIPQFCEDKTLFMINGLSILLNMFGMNYVYQALEKYDYITVRSILFKFISIALMFLLVHRQSDYIIYGAITVLASVGSYILNFTRIHKYIDFNFRQPIEIRKHLKPIFTLFAQSLAVSIYTNLDTVMLGFMKNDVDVGYYNAAVKVKAVLLSLVTSLGNVLLPRMSYYAKQKMKEDFMRTMLKALNFTILMSIPLAVYFAFYSKESILFLAGDGYVGSVLAMQIITVAVIPNGLTGVLGIQVLTAIEKEKYVLYSVIVGAITDFLLNLVMIPQMGAAGAALATTIAEFMVLFVQIYYTQDLLKQLKQGFRMHRYIILAIISAILAFWVKFTHIQSSFIRLVLSSITFFGVYMINLLITKEDIVLRMVDSILIKLKLRSNK